MERIMRYGVVIMILGLLVLCGCGKDKPAELPKTITGKDGATMVPIPAGEFLMGTDPSEIPALVQQYGAKSSRYFKRETPRHTVYLDAFYISKYEVTVGQYKEFVKATGHRVPDWSKVGKYSPTDKHPMIYVSWDDAVAYCEWAGGRLPTEAEWEKAARRGLVEKQYSWGSSISHNDANYSGTGGKDVWEYCAPVGSFPPNGCGLYDIAGNVFEWCADWYDENYYADSPSRSPKGPSSGKFRVLRGGSWYRIQNSLRVSFRGRDHPASADDDVGFRCVSQDSSDVTP